MIGIGAGQGDIKLHSVRRGILIEEGGAPGLVTLRGVPAAMKNRVFKGTHGNLRAHLVICEVIAAGRENDCISAIEKAFCGICHDRSERLTDLQPAVRNSSTGSRDITSGRSA